MTLLRALAFCATPLALAAPPASAAVVESRGGFIEVEANRGERNDMLVTWSDSALVVEDRTAPLRARGKCDQAGPRRVRCAGTPRAIAVELGDRADAFTARAPRRGPYPSIGEVDGDAGDDTLTLPYGELLQGDEGDDRVVIERSRIRRQANLGGGDGDDVLKGGRARDYLGGGAGNDHVSGGARRDRIVGGDGAFSDTDPGRDVLKGGSGADMLDDNDAFGHVSRDRLIGGRGNDRVMSYAERERGVVVDLSDRSGDGEPREDDILRGVEQVRGGAGDDRLVGDRDANKLEGWTGNDVVLGRGGDDRLVLFEDERARGGRGDDRITSPAEGTDVRCGGGDDTLAFLLAGTREEEPRGFLAPPDCEWMDGRQRLEYLKISAHPAITPDGKLEFTLAHFKCCPHTLSLTMPESPFEEIDSARVDSSRVQVDPGGRRGILRVSTLDAGENNTLVWRFDLGG